MKTFCNDDVFSPVIINNTEKKIQNGGTLVQ